VGDVALEKPLGLLKPKTPPPPLPPPPKNKKIGLAVGILVVGGIGVLGVAAKLGMDIMRSAAQSEATQPPDPEKRLTNKTVVAPTPAPAPPDEPLFKLEEEHYANDRLMARGFLHKLPDGRWVKHGAWTNYWLNGNISTWGNYDRGEKVGAWPFWLENGQTVSTNVFQRRS